MATVLNPEALSALSADIVGPYVEQAAALVKDFHPDVDIREGAFRSLVLTMQGLLAASLDELVALYMANRSLLELDADPDAADPTAVDAVLSNFLVTRQPGDFARGEIMVVRDNDLSATVAVGSIFTAGGRDYVTESAYGIKPVGSAASTPQDRVAVLLATGRYGFTIPVVATAAGSAYKVRRDTTFLPAVPPPGYITAYAVGDFSGGLDPESNAALLRRLREGIAARGTSNRVGYNAMLRDVPAYSRVVRTSIIGAADPEMRRSRRGVWPGATSGKVDWYIRTTSGMERPALRKTAKIVQQPGAYAVWQFELSRTEYAGAFEVGAIRPAGDTTSVGQFVIESRTYGLSFPSGFHPDIPAEADSAFTAYRTVAVRFQDARAASLLLAVNATAEFDVEVPRMPLIEGIQALMASRDYRSVAGDTLVKAPVPCIVQTFIKVHRRVTDPEVDAAGIRAAVAARINSVEFQGSLFVSDVADETHALLPRGISLSEVTLVGRLIRPDGAEDVIQATDVLTIPDDPDNMISAQTVQFFADQADVFIDTALDLPVPV